ncbi:MAG TPA: mannitol dehydrogenase family protein [Marmoricola sp.]|nr:mannitol dehydrogenase family protein [Marmoricola sp.]
MTETTDARLTRARAGRATAPVAVAHLGLGAFFRAHQAVYTDLAPDAEAWGIAAFTGRSPTLAEQLTAQDGLYTLLEQGPSGDTCSVISSVSRAHPGADLGDWTWTLADAATAVLTITVTEAAYLRTESGALRLDDPAVQSDLASLKGGRLTEVATVPGRLVAGLAARHAEDGTPIAVVPCDNLLQNGAAVRRIVLDLADELDNGVADWIRDQVSFVSSAVDRITPRTTDRDRDTVLNATGLADVCPVVAEPFSEWVIAGEFPAGRPGWEHAGALLVDDVTPYEQRKLWLLNGAHSLLAYAGSIRGHRTVADAMADETCSRWVEEWWAEAAPHLDLSDETVRAYCADLRTRFANPRIHHLLEQIAMDGSQKLPVRVLPVVRAERAAGRIPTAASRTLAAWVLHLRGAGAPVDDPGADELVAGAAGPLPDAVRRTLDTLDPALGSDTALTDAVATCAEELSRP